MENDDTIVVQNKQERLKMPICPECFSRDLVKFGTYAGQQRWQCKDCGYTTLYPRYRMPKPKKRKAK